MHLPKIDLSGIKERMKKKIGRDFFIFLFFLFLSSLFWLLNELNKESIADVSIPVHYENFFKDKILVNDVPSHIVLKIQAPGYTLLKYKLSPRLVPVSLDLKSYLVYQKGKSSVYYVVTKDLQGRLKRRFSGEMNILEIQPDTLYFRFDILRSRKVAVVPHINFSLEKQYMLSSLINTSPDSILVTGPSSIIDTLKNIHTINMDYPKLKRAVNEEVELILVKELNYAADKVIITIPVEQFTEATLKVPIIVTNLPDSLNLRTFPDQVTLTCNVALGRYESVSQRIFRAEVDYSSIKTNIGKQLKVKIASFPDYIQSVRISPAFVDFIIEKK